MSEHIADLVEAAAQRSPEAPALVVTADRIPVSTAICNGWSMTWPGS